MYHEKTKKDTCPGCKQLIYICDCGDMCLKCKFYAKNECTNTESGNFRVALTYDAVCSKFVNKKNNFTLKTLKYF